jgi:hypothetical protein
MKKYLMILVAIVCLGISAYAENGNFCSDDGDRLELYNDGAFQLSIGGKFFKGTYKITSDNTIIFTKTNGEDIRGRYTPNVVSRSTGKIITPASVTIAGYQLIKGKC